MTQDVKLMMRGNPEWEKEQELARLRAIDAINEACRENKDWLFCALNEDQTMNLVAMAREIPRKKMALVMYGGPALTKIIGEMNEEEKKHGH